MLLSIFNLGGSSTVADSKINIKHIEYVNERLEQGASLNALEKENVLGMSRKAYRNNAAKLGFVFNREKNQFIEGDNMNNTEITPRVTAEKVIKKDSKVNISLNEYEAIIKRLEALEDIMLQGNISVTHEGFELDGRVLNNDIMTRSVKVSKAAMDRFTELCETKLAMYSKQDVLSQALHEFVDKYE